MSLQSLKGAVMKPLKLFLITTCLILLIVFGYSIYKVILQFESFSKINIKTTPYTLKASEINLLNIRTDTLETIKFNNVKLINIWATWCKPCIKEQPSLEKLKKINQNIEILQLSFDSLYKQKQMVNKLNWTLPSYFLKDSSIFEMPTILPVTYVLKDTVVIKEFYGAKNWTDTSIINYLKTLTK